MAVNRIPSVDALIAQGLIRVNKGDPALPTARRLLAPWPVIPTDTKRALAEYGLAQLISNELKKQREHAESAAERGRRKAARAAAKVQLAILGLTPRRSHFLHRQIQCPQLVEEERFHKTSSKRHDPHKCVITHLGVALKTGDEKRIKRAVASLAISNASEQKHKDERERLSIPDRARLLFDEAVKRVLQRIIYKCDGGHRSLFDFQLEDVKSWQRVAREQSKSWSARADWFDMAAKTMTQARVTIVSELSLNALAELAYAAEETWRKDKAPWLPERSPRPVRGIGARRAGGSSA